ncbi:MAG TPA: archaeosortase/exosortase family protein [Verrucomicrobiae bacterium]|jgi:exosortase C (VPDSG-CTERM-specific)
MSVKELKLRAEKNQFAFEAIVLKRKKNFARLAGFSLAVLALALCFSRPLYNLFGLVTSDDLYTDIPLIPLISLYLIWIRRENLPFSLHTAIKPTALFSAAGLMILAAYWATAQNASWTIENYLAINVLALLLIFTGVCFFFFGKAFMSAIAFPMVLLVFTIPFPDFLQHGFETFLQYGSAICAGTFFHLSSVPVFRDGLNFKIPGCVIQVAPECSGIHSTLVLAITSLIGGWLFLRSPWKRTVLALAVIPLALIRNGFRIFVIVRLCAAYGPKMLASPIHHHGGPLFFALSLIPFFLLLLYLRKTERINNEPLAKKSL